MIGFNVEYLIFSWLMYKHLVIVINVYINEHQLITCVTYDDINKIYIVLVVRSFHLK
jgi:hypothetical protein